MTARARGTTPPAAAALPGGAASGNSTAFLVRSILRRGTGIGLVLLLAAAGGGPVQGEDQTEAARPAGLWGIVLDAGTPVPGATVLLYRGVSYAGSLADAAQVQHHIDLLDRLESTATPIASSRTDERGAFVFPALAPGTYVVEARGGQGTSGWTPVVPVEVGHFVGVPVALGRALTVEGSVVGPGGAPHRGSILVGAPHAGPGEAPTIPPVAVRHVTADAAGRFRLDLVPAGDWQLLAGQPQSNWEVVGSIGVDPGSAADGVVQVTGSLRARPERGLRLVDAAGGSVAGARVVLQGDGWLAGGTTSTEGSLRFRSDSGMCCPVHVAAPGFHPVQTGVKVDGLESVIELKPAARRGQVRGRLRAPDGTPAAGVAVRVVSGDFGYLAPRSLATCTGSDGTFVLDDVEAGPAWLLALGGGFAGRRLSGVGVPPRGEDLIEVPPGGAAHVEATLRRGRSLVGRVVDEDGAPVGGALLRWEVSPVEFIGHGIADAAAEEQVVRSGPDGSFRIPTVAARVPIEVTASAPGYVGVAVTVGPGSGGVEGRPVLVRLTPTRWLTVAVQRGGSAALGARVSLTCDDRRGWAESLHETLVVGRSGRVVAGPLPRRDLQVEVRDPESPQEIQVRVAAADDRPVRVSLEPGLEIAGRLVDAAGDPVAGVVVSAERRRGRKEYRAETTGADGRFRFGGLARSTWLLSAQHRAARAEATAEAGARDVRLVLIGDASDPGAVRVLVRGHDGGRVAQAAIRWNASGRSGGGFWVPGKEIEIRGEAGAEGLAIEVVDPRDAEGAPLPYGPGRAGPLQWADREIEIVLPPGRSVKGRVSVPAGVDPGGFRVVALGRSGLDGDRIAIGETISRPDGTFEIPSAGDEDAELSVRAGSNARVGLVSPVEARPGGEVVELPLVGRSDVALTVLTRDGHPAEGAFVSVSRRLLDEVEDHRARVDEFGQALVADVVPGAVYELTVQGTSEQGATLQLDHWIAGGGTLRLVPRLLIRGLVRDDLGAPYPRALVLLRSAGQWAGIAEADASGRFEMQAASRAEAQVLAIPPCDLWSNAFCEWGLGSKPVAARVGSPVSLVVARGVTVDFRLDARRPESWARMRLVLTRVDGNAGPDVPVSGGVALPPTGQGRLPPLLAGARYALYLPEGESGHCALTRFTAAEGQVVSLVPRQAGTVTGRVRGGPKGIPVRVWAGVQGDAVATLVAADGSFVLGGLPAGVRVGIEAVTTQEGPRWAGHAVAQPGEDVRIDLALAGRAAEGPR